MQIHECVGSEVRTEASRVLEFYLQFPYAAFRSIVVWRYCRVFEEVENIIPTFEQSIFESGELLAQL